MKTNSVAPFPGSSMVEHSAVNRNVGGSNPPRGAKIFVLNKLESLGRAFGFRPNARDVKCKWVARKLLNGKAFPEYVSKVNWRCHKNVVARVISELRNRC